MKVLNRLKELFQTLFCNKKTQKLNKLVRDNIPQDLIERGYHVSYEKLLSYNYHKQLIRKMHEETNEFANSRSDIAELADMYEVFSCIVATAGYDIEQVVKVAEIKRKYKGSFTNRYYVYKTRETATCMTQDKQKALMINEINEYIHPERFQGPSEEEREAFKKRIMEQY